MKAIALRHSDKFALVDDEDYDRLEPMGWCYHSLGYALRGGETKGSKIYMHRLIMDAPKGVCIDHIDFNKLNNTKANLRLCSHRENDRHRRVHCDKKHTQFKGVYWKTKRQHWEAEIYFNGKHKYLGTFSTDREGALAYNFAAFICFGNFAHLNPL